MELIFPKSLNLVVTQEQGNEPNKKLIKFDILPNTL